MSSQENNEELQQKLEKLKETINQTLGISNIKLTELEKELAEFQKELHSTDQMVTTEQVFDQEKILRLYKAERSLTEILQKKILDLENQLTEFEIKNRSLQTTESLLLDFKDFFSQELAKYSTPLAQVPKTTSEITGQIPKPMDNSIGELLSSENKQTKEMKIRLEQENQELLNELEYYKEKNENLKNELQFRSQEVQSLKKLMHEQEQEAEETYLTKQSVNDEYGLTFEEEFELTKEELDTLKGKYLTLETENLETFKQIDNYKKELTDLKKVLEKKNADIKDLRQKIDSKQNTTQETPVSQIDTDELNNKISQLSNKVRELEIESQDLREALQLSESTKDDLRNTVKMLEHKIADAPVESLELEVDKLRKAVWKIEKKIKVFDTGISTDAQTFERHMEVYGILLNDIFNARGYALILDILLKHRGKALTKKMVMTESKTEPHVAIRLLRELHDSKVIHFDEQLDQIIWRKN